MLKKQDIFNAQDDWGTAIVDIGKKVEDRAECKRTAAAHVEELYALNRGDILFKPTKAAEIPFRRNFEGTLSYFIGGNDDFPEDNGFALQPWTDVRFENSGLVLEELRALAMGHYFFTDRRGEETKAEYTFGYIKTAEGSLAIDVHHSSFPYQAGS